jgi:hypothetical protein
MKRLIVFRRINILASETVAVWHRSNLPIDSLTAGYGRVKFQHRESLLKIVPLLELSKTLKYV